LGEFVNISITPWVKQNLVDVRVGIDYRSSLGKDDFISMEKDQDDSMTDKGEFSMTNQEETEFAKTNIENHIL
jgi:hypothetical protein